MAPSAGQQICLGRLALPCFGRSAQPAGGNAADLLGMDFQLVLDQAAMGNQSPHVLSSRGFGEERLVVVPARSDDLPSTAPRGLVYGLPIAVLLWAVIAFGVWVMWLR